MLTGLSKAAELLLSGRTFSGREAAEWGVAGQALPADQVRPAALELAADIAANTAPLSVAISKRMLWAGLGVDLADFRNQEGRWLTFTTGAPDSTEGTSSFLEKRAPQWRGRLTIELPPDPPESGSGWLANVGSTGNTGHETA